MKVRDFVVVSEGTIIIEVPDIVHMENLFGVKDIEFIACFDKVVGKLLGVADGCKVSKDIVQFGECLWIADIEWIGKMAPRIAAVGQMDK